ncbi:MAG: tryptophan-rich sensory protein [Flavobacteriales bacterium]|nr:tryptophan-rich sensory protein [Flavobacteriales bacterium]
MKIAISIIVCLVIGYAGSFATASSVNDWYLTLNKPIFNPPNWIFGPVWTLLYILMGISFGVIWQQQPSNERNVAMLIFAIQLLLNLSWSFLFFYFKLLLGAFIEIVILWIFIAACIIVFYKIKSVAGYLLIPYILWVSFATILNFSIYWLNKT